VADAEQRLNRLLGRPLDQGVRLVDEPVVLEPPRRDAVSIALSTRPELLALDHRREAAEAAIAQAQAERRPTISTVAEAAVQTTTDVMEGHSEFIGLEFAWPILSHPASRARERGARAGLRELEQTKADLEAVIALQVAESARRVTDARERVAAAQEALAAAAATAREARVARQAGTATRQTIVTAESALEQARARQGQAAYGLSAALLGRARALGVMRGMFLVGVEEAGT
jgi:outer membrane protein TolC